MATRACDVAVVGAGPAGAAAAVTAARAGARVLLLDGEQRPGGQYWRHGPDGPGTPGEVAEHAAEWRALARRLALELDSGRVAHLPRTRVWRVDAGAARPGVLLQAAGPGGEPLEVAAAALVLATGAHDRVLPFPGWDLPGVLTAGAAQALLKEHGVAAGSRAVVAGTGPFLLPVAVGLAEAGVRGGRGRRGRRRARLGARLAGRRGSAGQGRRRRPATPPCSPGTGSRCTCGRPWWPRTATTGSRASPSPGSTATGPCVPGSERDVACDVAAVGWGFTARLELALQAGCATASRPRRRPGRRRRRGRPDERRRASSPRGSSPAWAAPTWPCSRARSPGRRRRPSPPGASRDRRTPASPRAATRLARLRGGHAPRPPGAARAG